MDFNAISTDRRRSRQDGMNLIQMMIAVGIGAMLMGALASATVYTARSFAAITNYADLDARSRNALDQLTREVRQTLVLTGFATNALTFRDYDSNILSFVYNPTNRTLVRNKTNSVQTLLTECDQLVFSIYQRNTTNSTYDQFPAASTNTCKLIQVSWICSRQIFGKKVNTESVQTAKIVIRKRT
jgi:Tfp pilus assembly protein PilW